MRNRDRKSDRVRKLLLILSLALGSARAQDGGPQASPTSAASGSIPTNISSETQVKLLGNFLETGGSYMTLTNGFGYWASGYSRAVYARGQDVWNAELNAQHEFGDTGAYFAVGDTHTLNADWYASLTVGSSAGGFFLPRFRSDGFLNRKWLRRRQWVTSAGFGYVAAKDVHRDHVFFLGSTYYFAKPWIFETGAYFDISDPGRVLAPAGFVALTLGHNKHQYLVVRAGLGEVAYQLIGPSVSLTQFQSQTLTLTWRKWIGTNWGFNLVGDYYHSPFYQRGGTSFGLFKEF
ncbi:MAG TPA: YaiO family outer membrane beta-barrel protein [Terriglobales bacterium]|nr:YaiO family outer membrane beta-barrel protein [Terriglobales bacterium]